jgi:hypothetical protein
LFYRPVEGYYLAVVARRLNGDGFVITSTSPTRLKKASSYGPHPSDSRSDRRNPHRLLARTDGGPDL